jgi:hypothetical protein
MEAADQGVDLGRSVVKVEGRPRGGGNPEPQVERAGAVMPYPHGHAEVVIQDLPDVVRVNPFKSE